MPIPKILDHKAGLLIISGLALGFSLLACKVNVHDRKNGGDDKLDIETPIGGIHINQQADVRDTGLTVYPGARQKQMEKDGGNKSANVNISSSFFGVKVVAVEYESDDPPEKVLSFYEDQLKKFGHVVQCQTSKHGGDFALHTGGSADNSREVRCESSGGGNVVELKAGTEGNQRLVSVEPQGKGSDFSLVYAQAHGKEGTI